MSDYNQKVARLEKLKRLKELRAQRDTTLNPADFQIAEEKAQWPSADHTQGAEPTLSGYGLSRYKKKPSALGLAVGASLENVANIGKRMKERLFYGIGPDLGKESFEKQEALEAARPGQSFGQNFMADVIGFAPYIFPPMFPADVLSAPERIPEMAKGIAHRLKATTKAVYGDDPLLNITRPFKESDLQSVEEIRQAPFAHLFDVALTAGVGPKLVKSGAKKVGAGVRDIKAIRSLAEPKPAEPPIMPEVAKPVARKEMPDAPKKVLTPQQKAKLVRFGVVKPDKSVEPPPAKPVKPVEGVAEGEMKPSRLAERTEADAIEANLTEKFGELPEYKTMNMKDQAKRAKEVLDADYEQAKRMAMGEVEPPSGLRPASMYEAVKLRALKEGDVTTLHKIATESKLPTRLSELGQEIKAADSRIMDDPVRAMQDIGKTRKEKAKKVGARKVEASKVEQLSKELDATKKVYDDLVAQRAAKRRPIQYGAKNKVVTKDVYQRALTDLRAATARVSIGIDPQMVANLGKVGAYHFEAGSRAFAQWSTRMMEDTGGWARPHLAKLWANMEATRRQSQGLKSNKTRLANQIEKFTDKLNDLDFEKIQRKKTIFDAEARALRSKYEQARRNYEAAAEASGAVTKTEAAKIVELSRKMELKKDKIATGGDRLEYGAAKVQYVNYINALKGEGAPLKSMAKARVGEFKTTWRDNRAEAIYNLGRDAVNKIIDMSVSMVGSWDNSFLGRQGLHTLMTHPTQWFPAARKSFSDFVKTLGGKNAYDANWADIYSRENYINGNYQKAKILARTEEQFPTSLPGRVPVLGRVFKASEYAFTGSAVRMRTGLFDLFAKRAKANGVAIDKAWLESFGKVTNSLTARGQWGKRGDPPFIRLILWAPKMLKANIDVLTAHGAGMALKHPMARREAAINLLKIVGETAMVMVIANALKPGSAEYNLISSDFGDIKIGKTRFDITGGASSIVTLAARIITRKTKNPVTGEIREYGIGYGQKSPFDAMIDFLANKTNPPARVLVDALRGRHYDYTPFELKKSAYGAATPISIQQAISLKDNASADAVAGVIADFIGVSANTFEDRKKGRASKKPER